MNVVSDFESNYPELDGTTVYIGDTPNMVEDMSNIIYGDRSPADKFFRGLSMPLHLQSKLSRGDHYNPMTNSVTLFTPSKDILRHELGHAVDNARNYGGSRVLLGLPRMVTQNAVGVPFAIDPISVAQEVVATGTGARTMKDATPEEKRKYSRNNGAALGGYTGALLGTGLSAIYGSGKNVLDRLRSGAVKYIPFSVLGGTLLGGLAGHIIGNMDWLPGHSSNNNDKLSIN